MTAVSDLASVPGALAIIGSVDARLREMAQLEADWDSYGAAPIDLQAIAAAEQVIKAILLHAGGSNFFVSALRVDVVPLADGGVQVEWAGPEGRIDIEVAPEGAFNYLLMQGQGETETFTEREGVTRTEVLQAIEVLFSSGA